MVSSNLDRAVEVELATHETVTQQAQETSNIEGHQETVHQSLEPVDGGWAAWRMLITAFVFESLLWGFPLSFGVFQNYYSHLPEFADQPYISVIGTVASGICYMGAPIIIPMLNRLAGRRKQMIWVGWTICITGVLASSFAQTIWVLILTQGLMYGFGFIIFYYPIISMVNEFWVARRGMAYGILCSASGVSGIVMPFALEALLNRFGRAVTLRAVTVALVVSTGPLIPCLKGRLRPSGAPTVSPRVDMDFLTVPLFWVYTMSNLLQGLAYFFPSLYLPSYASTLGLSPAKGAALLATMSVSQVLGQFSFGYLSDRKISLNTLCVTSTCVSAVAVFFLWGLAHSFPPLVIFGLLYGFFGAGYVAMWARMGTAVTSDATAAFTAFGLFNFGKGIGNVLTGPIGANLTLDPARAGSYAAGKYKAVILFTGTCLLASGVSVALTFLRHLRPSQTQR